MGVYLVGMAIVVIYLVNAYRVWGGKVTSEHEYADLTAVSASS